MVKSLNFQSHFQLMGPTMIIIQAGAFEKKITGLFVLTQFWFEIFSCVQNSGWSKTFIISILLSLLIKGQHLPSSYRFSCRASFQKQFSFQQVRFLKNTHTKKEMFQLSWNFLHQSSFWMDSKLGFFPCKLTISISFV